MHSPDGFAHVLFPEIEALLARHNLKITDIEGFAAAAGPGSFTGVRVGLTAAKGLAEATHRKVIAVSNLQAVASFGTRALRAPVIDARRGDIFGAVYDADLRLVAPEVVMRYEDFLRTLPEGDVEVINRASETARRSHRQNRRGASSKPDWRRTPPRSTRTTSGVPMRN